MNDQTGDPRTPDFGGRQRDLGSIAPGPDADLVQDPQLEALLEAYADARLSLGLAATTQMRSVVMTAAHRRSALIEADRTVQAADQTWSARDVQHQARIEAERRRTPWQRWRRPMAAVFAGVLTLAVLIGTAWAARPGGPLYAARLWTEMANLPADIIARADAEVTRLQARIDEAQDASSGGDAVGAQAALAAYSRIVVEAAMNSAGDPRASSAIEVSVQAHVVVLNQMVETVPAAAKPAVQDAIEQSGRALKDLAGDGGLQPPPSSDGSTQTGRSGGRPVGLSGDKDAGARPAATAESDLVGAGRGIDAERNVPADRTDGTDPQRRFGWSGLDARAANDRAGGDPTGDDRTGGDRAGASRSVGHGGGGDRER